MPAPLSMYDVVFEVPAIAPITVADESASNARSISSTSPLSFTRPVRLATDVNVPAVSMKSTNKKAKAVPIKPAVANIEKSSWKACSGDGTAPTTPLNDAVPVTHANTDTTKIPIITAPGTPRRSRTAMMIKPRPASNTGADAMSPKPTRVAGLSTTTPAF